MAKPRVFVSSTHFDLRTVRDDLDRFIREVGYEPVRHELGQISYGKDHRPEEYAYREIDYCDIVVCIIGGRFGTPSSDGSSSITQKEIRGATERGKQVYIFVDEAVYHEHRHYLANKSVPGVKYVAVDNPAIHAFLEEIYALPKGNPIFSFSVSADIVRILREQWSGLFQRLLSEAAIKSQTVLIEELQRSLQTVGQLVEFLASEKGKGDQAVQQILFANHPFFSALREATRNPYRLYFNTFSELQDWLKAARNFTQTPPDMQDLPDYFEWMRTYTLPGGKEETHILYINKCVFSEEGDIKPITPAAWRDDYVRYERLQPQPITRLRNTSKERGGFDSMDDDIPF